MQCGDTMSVADACIRSFIDLKAYARFTCHDDGTVTVEEDCDSASCDSCRETRAMLNVPACYTVTHGDEEEVVTVDCVGGNALVQVYDFPGGEEASCPLGAGAVLGDEDEHVSGQCEEDAHGHADHDDHDGHDDHDDHEDHDDHDDHDEEGTVKNDIVCGVPAW